MKLDSFFSDADLEVIKEATTAAERHTGGEIVPYIVKRVVDHDEAKWRGAAIGALTAALAAGLLYTLGDYWLGLALLWITLPVVIGAGLGYLITGMEAIERFLIAQDHMERAVRIRAQAAFLEETVFQTRDRTGVLIFLTIFERRAVILADEGINQAVPDGKWEELVKTLVNGIRRGRATEAMCDVIGRCGDLLERYDVRRRTNDQDELADAPRVRER